MIQVAPRYAINLAAKSCTRRVLAPGPSPPNATIIAIHLGLYAKLLSGDRTFPAAHDKFKAVTWGYGTVIVRIRYFMSSQRHAVPYVLLFVSSTYWSGRVIYELTCSDFYQQQAADAEDVIIQTMPSAGLAVVVVIDCEQRGKAVGTFLLDDNKVPFYGTGYTRVAIPPHPEANPLNVSDLVTAVVREEGVNPRSYT